jgi:hypothetical protein
VNVVSYNGGKVHSAMPGMPEGHAYPLCRGGGMNQMVTKFRTIDAPLTCKTCLTYAERRAARLATEPDSVTPEGTTDEGETMAEMKSNDVSTDEGKAVLEQIDANVERASSLAEAENVEGLKELEGETETLISSLSGKGSIKAKTEKRDAFRAAATVQEKPKAEVVPVITYDQIPGVPELIDMGVEKAVEGVRLHLKAVDTARELAKIGLDMWLRMENKKKIPDLMGDSDQAKKSSKAMNEKIGQALAKEQGLSEYEVVQAVAKFSRSIQTQRSNVRAQFLRSLDEDTEEAAEAREVFAGVLKGKPKDVPVSRWVADAYGTSLVGQTEIDAIEYHIKRKGVEGLPEKYKALAAYEPSVLEQTGAAQLEAAANPDEILTGVVDALESEFKKIEKVAKPESIESASEDVKKAQRERMEPMFAFMKELIAATL